MCVKWTTKVGMAVSNLISVTIETMKEKKEKEMGEGERKIGRTRKGLKT